MTLIFIAILLCVQTQLRENSRARRGKFIVTTLRYHWMMPGHTNPPPFDVLADRTFSFFPPIVGIEHNQYQLKETTWSEILVVNSKSGDEFWLSRRYLGEISRVEEPVVILGLRDELELRAGQVVPYSRKVLELPRVLPHVDPQVAAQQAGAPPVNMGLQGGTEDKIGKLILVALIAGVALCGIVLWFLQRERDPGSVQYKTVLQADLPFDATTDFPRVISRLGKPASEAWRTSNGEMQYRVLRYPDRRLGVILMGTDRDKALYIGSVDLDTWRPVHSVALPDGRHTSSLLRSLPRF